MLSQELVQSIANYLVTKPYNEVFMLINEIQKQVQVQPKEETPVEQATEIQE